MVPFHPMGITPPHHHHPPAHPLMKGSKLKGSPFPMESVCWLKEHECYSPRGVASWYFFPLYHNVPVGHKKILFLFQHIAAGGHQGISIFNVEYFLCDISYTDILYLSQESIKALQFSMLNIFCRRASIYCIPIYYICCRRASRNFNFQC